MKYQMLTTIKNKYLDSLQELILNAKEKTYSHSDYLDKNMDFYSIKKIEIPEFYYLEEYNDTFSKFSFFD